MRTVTPCLLLILQLWGEKVFPENKWHCLMKVLFHVSLFINSLNCALWFSYIFSYFIQLWRSSSLSPPNFYYFFFMFLCSWRFGQRKEKLLDWGQAWAHWCLKCNAWINYVQRGKRLKTLWERSGKRLKSLMHAELNLNLYTLPYLELTMYGVFAFNIHGKITNRTRDFINQSWYQNCS